MAQSYIIPDGENKKITEKLGSYIEMQTFKTNVKPDLTMCNSSCDRKPEVKHGGQLGEYKVVKLVCCGDFSGNWSKQVYINDYTATRPPAKDDNGICLAAECYSKCLDRRCKLSNTDYTIKLQIWETGEYGRFLNIFRTYFKEATAAIVFWGARSGSFRSALKWKEAITNATKNDVPVVLIVDNVTRSGPPVSWLGSGMLVNSSEAMDEFCVEHGFIAWFEMRSRDWESGEKSVFGQAVSRVVDEAMKPQLCELVAQ